MGRDGIILSSHEEMVEFGKTIGSRIKPGSVLALSGDLGAGKTTFVQGLAQSLGIFDPIQSPTFVYMNSYVGRLYRNNLKNREFSKEGPQNLHSERATIAGLQGVSENLNFEENPMQLKTDSSECIDITLFHFDLYRMKGEDDFLGLGFDECFMPNSVCVVEWPERIQALLPKHTIHISFAHEEKSRRIVIS